MNIPNDWKVKRLEKLVQFSSGGTPSKANKSYWQGDIPWISASTMHQQEIISSDLFISEAGLSAGSKLAKKNDLLLLVRGSMLWKKIPICLCKRDVAFNQDVKSLSVNKSIQANYLLYWFLANQRFLLNKVVGTGIGAGKLDFDALKALDIPIPPLPEQKAIVDLLSTWDEAIEKTERLFQEKENLFKRLLNDLIFVPAEVGKWKQVLTKSLFKERKESKRGDLPLLSITNSEGVIPRDETKRKDSSNEDKSKYLRICPGDIGYNTMRMWQGVSALSTWEGIVSPAYTVCVIGEKLYPLFVAYLFKMPFLIHRFYRYSQGLTSDTWNLKYRNFCEVKMPLPSLDEQQQIAESLNAAQQEIDILKQLLEKYKSQKRGLMQKLLTGEWRMKTEIVKQYMEV